MPVVALDGALRHPLEWHLSETAGKMLLELYFDSHFKQFHF